MRTIILRILLMAIAAATIQPLATIEAAAQATCRQKCTDEEQACLRRTGNKGQCGERAKVCVAACK